MNKAWFKFNNIRSDNRDIKIISLPQITMASEKIEEIPIDGMDGFLTESKGYDGEIKEVEADWLGQNPTELYNWLKGTGEVIFSNQPDRYYKCRISNQIPFSEYIRNQIYNFLIQFRCQPFGYLLDGKETLTFTGTTILNHNKATYPSKPIITILGTGACTFTINSRTFNITDIVGGSITIDSDIEEVYEGKGNKMVGAFPYLDVGENNISYTGNVTSVQIKTNWRALS